MAWIDFINNLNYIGRICGLAALLGYFIIEEQKRGEKPKFGAVNFIPFDSIDFFF